MKAYIAELESLVSQLEEENAHLSREQVLLRFLPSRFDVECESCLLSWSFQR